MGHPHAASPPEACAVLDLPDEAATEALARRLAAVIRSGDVVALWGGLGAGKTAFARAFIRAAGDPAEEVPSPTFTLVQTYALAAGPCWHFDLYRLRSPDEAWELGIEDAFAEGIVLIEWPERLGSLLPAERLDIHLESGATRNARRARLAAYGLPARRLAEAGLV
jgi:tRNA threonylcarbamoyladenosine biosynthesis protein TsaE